MSFNETAKERWLESHQYVCSEAQETGPEIMCGPDTFSNVLGDKNKKKLGGNLFVQAQTNHQEEWVCFSLVSVDRA